VKLRDLLTKIQLRLRPLQLGQGGQPAADEADGLAGTSEAQTIEEQHEERRL
jgi:hypothetical protein